MRILPGAAMVAAVAMSLSGFPTAAAPASPDRVGVTSFEFVSEPGDPIGGGRSGSYRVPDDRIDIGGTADDLTVGISPAGGEGGWEMHLAPSWGANLRPGVYRDAERADLRTGWAPGLYVKPSGRDCIDIWGEFTIEQIQTDEYNRVTTLEARFLQRCGAPDAPALRGTVRYQVFPLSYSFTSDPGDPVGLGQAKTYTGSTTRFAIQGTSQGFAVRLSGLRDSWDIQLTPAEGARLGVGTYPDAQRAGFQQPGHPGLFAMRNALDCPDPFAGSFTITELVTDDNDTVVAVAATLEQHCAGGAPALRATINYQAGGGG